jgi:hypothetical protein
MEDARGSPQERMKNMAFEPKNMTASLFRNEKKEKDTHPDLTGSGLIDGRKVFLSAWSKRTKDGDKFLSLSFKYAEDQPTPRRNRDGDEDFF